MANRKSDHSPLLDHEDAADGAFRLPDVEPLVENLLRRLREVNGVRRAVAVGDYRRRKETLDRLDILVACDEDSPVMDRFVNDKGVAEVHARGKTHSSACSDDGMPIDLRIIPEDDFGLALHHFTGSADHVGALRNVDVLQEEPHFATRTEEEVYEALGLPFIPPELRENRGEIEAARNGSLPKLIALDDIRGDLHSHTTASDGRSTLEQMAAAAQKRGYEYLAVTDHSTYAMGGGGMNESRLRRQMERIDELNEGFDGFRLLKGLETDIRKDGSLDMSDAFLAELDIVVCSLHTYLDLPEEQQTNRVIRAMDNPYFNIYAHPTAKLAGYYDAIQIDLEQVLEAALERGCYLELNSKPERLDLNDVWCKRAKEMGVKLAVSTDAHETRRLAYVRFGIGQARRGWLEAEDVLNTRTWSELQPLLRRG